MNPGGLILIAAGAFTFLGGVMDWEWFMNHYKARLVVAILGRAGARGFYALAGVVFMIMGLLMTIGRMGGSS